MMKDYFGRENYYLRLLTDILVLMLSFYLTSVVSNRNNSIHDREVFVLLVIVWYFSSKIIHVYDDFRTLKFIDEFLLLVPVIAIQALVLILFLFFLNDRDNARRFVLEYCAMLFVFLSIKKYLLKKSFEFLRRKGRNTRNLLIVGSSEMGVSFFDFVKNNTQFGYNPIGFIDETKSVYLNGLYKGNFDEVDKIIIDNQIDEIVVAMPQFNKQQLDKIISAGERNAVRTRIIPDYFKFSSNKFKMGMFGNFPMITVRDEPLNQLHWRLIKRIIDLFFSLLLCVLIFSWLFPIIALLIRLESKGNIFFIQERWGKNKEIIRCLKFRTMFIESKVVVDGKFQQTTENDPRITKIGRILRKTNLDELPQFLNVIGGSMSVVGPRPHALQHNIESQALINNYALRNWVKPGVTGWAQVNGLRGETKDFSLMRKRVVFDIWYIENWTPWLDFKIVIMTVYNMFRGEDMAY